MIRLGPCPNCDCAANTPCSGYPLTLDVDVPGSGWDFSACPVLNDPGGHSCWGDGLPVWDGLIDRDPNNNSTECQWTAIASGDPYLDVSIAGLRLGNAVLSKGAGGLSQTLSLSYRCFDGSVWVLYKFWQGNLNNSESPAGTYTRDPAATLGTCSTCKGCAQGVESITVTAPPP